MHAFERARYASKIEMEADLRFNLFDGMSWGARNRKVKRYINRHMKKWRITQRGKVRPATTPIKMGWYA